MTFSTMLTTVTSIVRRYWLAEVVSTLGTLGFASIAAGNGTDWQQASLATLLSVVSYYSMMLAREIQPRLRHQTFIAALIGSSRNLAIEFGLAELLDSLLVRPTVTWCALQWTNNPALGFMLGKLIADALFYAPAIWVRQYQLRLQPKLGLTNLAA